MLQALRDQPFSDFVDVLHFREVIAQSDAGDNVIGEDLGPSFMNVEVPEVTVDIVLDFVLAVIDVELCEPIPDLLLDQIFQHQFMIVADLVFPCTRLVQKRRDVLDEDREVVLCHVVVVQPAL